MKQQQRFFGVIASIMADNPADFFRAIAQARALQVTTIELRLDSLGQGVHGVLDGIKEAIGDHQTILTLRSGEQGGKELFDYRAMVKFWQGLPSELRDLVADPDSDVVVDWDYDFIQRFVEDVAVMPFPWYKVGCSWHHFGCTGPSRPLSRILPQLEGTPAWAFIKLVNTPHEPESHCAELEELFARRIDTRPLIAFGMGEHGVSSRYKCLGIGSAGTYGYVMGFQAAAPGQVSVEELMADPEVRSIVERRFPSCAR